MENATWETKFRTFMKEVDKALNGMCGMSSSDLDDYRYADCFDGGMSAEETAIEALEYSCESMGYDFDELFG